MRVRLIKRKTIESYKLENSKSRKSFDSWLVKLKNAEWQNANDIKATFGSADLIGNNSHRVIFNIGGNNYRIICKYGFGKKYVHLFVNWIGTHSEYTKLCDDNLQYTINLY